MSRFFFFNTGRSSPQREKKTTETEGRKDKGRRDKGTKDTATRAPTNATSCEPNQAGQSYPDLKNGPPRLTTPRKRAPGKKRNRLEQKHGDSGSNHRHKL